MLGERVDGQHSIVVYSTPDCAACERTKKWLSAQGFGYTEIDVSKNVAARDELLLAGYREMPVVDVVDVTGYHKTWSGFRYEQLKGLQVHHAT